MGLLGVTGLIGEWSVLLGPQRSGEWLVSPPVWLLFNIVSYTELKSVFRKKKNYILMFLATRKGHLFFLNKEKKRHENTTKCGV